MRSTRLRAETAHPDRVVLSPNGGVGGRPVQPGGAARTGWPSATPPPATPIRTERLAGEALDGAAFSPDGASLVVGSTRHSRVTRLTVATGNEVSRTLGQMVPDGPGLRLAFTADGRSVIAADPSGTIGPRMLAATDLSPPARSGRAGPGRGPVGRRPADGGRRP